MGIFIFYFRIAPRFLMILVIARSRKEREAAKDALSQQAPLPLL